MKIDYELTRVVKLELTEEEAVWLQAFMQNPPAGPENEPRAAAAMRERFFNGLTMALRGEA